MTEPSNDPFQLGSILAIQIHGKGNVAIRTCAVIYDPKYKIKVFGRFCSMELAGTLRSDEAPPINGRMVKALRYLGFKVRAT